MDAELREHAAFYLTGRRSDADHDPVEELGMRPALLAGYRDLTTLRYDFPIVLLKDSPDGSIAEPLSGLIDRALAEAAVSGHDGERLRIHALRLERELRSMAARGVSGSLLALLDLAARHLAPGTDASLLADSVRRLQEALRRRGAHRLRRCAALAPVDTRLASRAAEKGGGISQEHRPFDPEAQRDLARRSGPILGSTHAGKPESVGRRGL